MNNVMDFFTAALPWIGIGLFAVINIVKKTVEGKEESKISLKKLSRISLVSLVCFFFVAAMEFKDGDRNGAAVWICLAIVNFIFFIQFEALAKNWRRRLSAKLTISNKPSCASSRSAISDVRLDSH